MRATREWCGCVRPAPRAAGLGRAARAMWAGPRGPLTECGAAARSFGDRKADRAWHVQQRGEVLPLPIPSPRHRTWSAPDCGRRRHCDRTRDAGCERGVRRSQREVWREARRQGWRRGCLRGGGRRVRLARSLTARDQWPDLDTISAFAGKFGRDRAARARKATRGASAEACLCKSIRRTGLSSSAKRSCSSAMWTCGSARCAVGLTAQLS